MFVDLLLLSRNLEFVFREHMWRAGPRISFILSIFFGIVLLFDFFKWLLLYTHESFPSLLWIILFQMFLISSVLLLLKEQKLKDFKKTQRKIFWEGHKNFKESSTLGDNFWAKTQFKSYAEILFLSSSDFLKIPLVFSEHLNIIIVIHIFGSIQCPLLLLFSDLKWSMKLFTVWHLPFQFYIFAFLMLQMGKFYGTWIR